MSIPPAIVQKVALDLLSKISLQSLPQWALSYNLHGHRAPLVPEEIPLSAVGWLGRNGNFLSVDQFSVKACYALALPPPDLKHLNKTCLEFGVQENIMLGSYASLVAAPIRRKPKATWTRLVHRMLGIPFLGAEPGTCP